MEKLRLEIVTPDKTVLDAEVDFASIPGIEGIFGVLPGHIAFLSALKVGSLHYTQDNKTHYVFIGGGFAEIANNTVRILADAAEKEEDIDIERAEKARERAAKRLQDAAREETNITRAEAALLRAITRLGTKHHF